MQYIWQHRLYKSADMVTNDGRRVRVLDPGLLNRDAGPDFFNAKVEIDGQLWVGNVEMHVRASDWRRHHHDRDTAYDSVILHVVDKDDAPVYRTGGERIPQLVLQVSPLFLQQLNSLMNAPTSLPCSATLSQLPLLKVTEWLERMAMERLQNKTERTLELLDSFAGSWEDVCYVTLSRNLGFGVNNDAFERLARRTPLRLLRKHSDSLLQLEAFLLGQAGLLDSSRATGDPYVDRLTAEYAFLANKFSLQPLERDNWKLFRLRPQNFPYRRIAMLAHFIHGGFRLMEDILEADGEKQLRALFQVTLTGFWATHYTLDGKPARPTPALGNASIDIVLINTVATLLYAHGSATANERECDRAIKLLESLRPEKNRIIAEFETAGIACDNAFTSQAMIELKRNYCEARKCIYCKFGHHLLSQVATTN